MSLLRKPAFFAAAVLWAGITLINILVSPGRYSPHVQVETLKTDVLPIIVRASGALDAKASITLKAQFDGPVADKRFREGQQVAKGDLLAVIGRDRIRLEYETKHNALLNAQADLSKARREVKLQQALFQKEAVAYSSVEDAERAVVKAKQDLKGADEAFNLELIRWNSSNLVAPFTGTIVKDGLADDKQIANGREIVTLADVSEYKVVARVDELDIKQVSEGLPAEVRVQIYPQTVFKANVIQIGSASEGSGVPEIPVTLKLGSTQGVLLRPKLTADVRILTGQTPPTVSVPLTAIANSDGQPRVWVLDLLSRVHPRRVEVGKSNPERVEVKKGLSAGERVCLTAQANFTDGMKVMVKE